MQRALQRLPNQSSPRARQPTRNHQTLKARRFANRSMADDYHEWRAMGEGGTAPNWAGYLSNLNAEKTMAFEDTLDPGIYRNPEKYASGWSKASPSQRAAARTSFLKDPLPQRQGPRARAKRFVFPQREKNALDPKEPRVKQVGLTAISCRIPS